MRNALIGVAKSSSTCRKGRIGREKMNAYCTRQEYAGDDCHDCTTSSMKNECAASLPAKSKVDHGSMTFDRV
jgi:hypothetical protein